MKKILLKESVSKLKRFLLVVFLFGILFFSYSQKHMVIYSKDSLHNAILQKINTSKTVLSYQGNLNNIGEKLNKLGFLNYKIISKKESDSLISINYSLNKQVKVFRIKIGENKLLTNYIENNKVSIINDEIHMPFKDISVFLAEVLTFYEKKGYPFAKVKLINLKFYENYAVAELQIDFSKVRKIDKVIVEGYDKFPEKFIRNYLNINTSTLFSKKTIQQISDRIQSISFVEEIKKPQVLFKKDSTLIYIYLKNKRQNQFDGVVGMYGNEDGKLKFNGHLKLALQNIFHKGERLHLHWKSNEDNKKLEIGMQLPYIFKTRFNTNYNFSIYSQDSSYINITSKLNIIYSLNNKNSIGGIIRNEKSTILLKKDIAGIADYTVTAYGANYGYNSKKIKYSSNTDVAYIEYTYGKQKIINNNIVKHNIRFTGAFTYPINRKNFIRIKNRTSLLFSKSYINNELDLIGGNNSIKGFRENSIPASKYSILQLSYNYVLTDKSSVYSITDYAFVENSLLKTTNSLYSIGLGYKTKLKASHLNLNYTLGITKNQEIQINNAVLHIGFINNF